MRIAFLHTIDDNPRIFEAAARQLGLRAVDFLHEVRPHLREAVQQAGAMPADVKEETRRCIRELAARAHAVVVTCATLGAALEETESTGVSIVRADVALASAAGKASGKVVVLCAVESAVEPNRQLFARHASPTVNSVEVIHVEAVWTLFRNGELDACFAALAAATHAAYENGAARVAYAHPWMAPAARLVREDRQPLDSARAALRAVMERSGKGSA